MQSIRKRLSILMLTCITAAIMLITVFVNIAINSKFNEYLMDAQNKRYERIVSYLEETYKKDKGWDKNSSTLLIHDAYMGNYCLTLLDAKGNALWGMNPSDIKNMPVQYKGVYTTKRFQIKVNEKLVGYVDIGQYSSLLLTQDDINFKFSINRNIILSGIAALLIISLVSLYISKQFSEPIKEVANMSVNLSKGNFDEKSITKSNIQELENLRESINILAEKLKNQNMLRKRLVSDISHEIRTPLNILQNNLEAMIDGVFPVTNERLNYINNEVIRFGKLLNNLDALKEFEAETAKLNLEEINLNELLKDLCEDFKVEAEERNIDLIFEDEPFKNYLIKGDRDKIKQIFINLISNALKFTKENGKIAVNLYCNDKKIIAEIKDNGMGISREDIPFIFERLYRGDKSRNKTSGTGIGLTIVKNILDLHNAEIEVKSQEGIGTHFKIYFNEYKEN